LIGDGLRGQNCRAGGDSVFQFFCAPDENFGLFLRGDPGVFHIPFFAPVWSVSSTSAGSSGRPFTRVIVMESSRRPPLASAWLNL
jgi:hypothetical protein